MLSQKNLALEKFRDENSGGLKKQQETVNSGLDQGRSVSALVTPRAHAAAARLLLAG